MIKKTKVEQAADLAIKMCREDKLPMNEAITLAAEEYDLCSKMIARELNGRSQLVRRKKAAKPVSSGVIKITQEMIRGAYAHERHLMGSFALAGHLDDY